MSAALARIPDVPRWVDTRGMLLSGRATVVLDAEADPARDGFLVVAPDVSLVSAVGQPTPSLVAATVAGLAGDVNLLAQNEDAVAIAAALPGWKRRTAILHVLPGEMPWEADEDAGARIFTRANAPRLDHVPEGLRLELLDALGGRTTARFVPGALPGGAAPGGRPAVPMAAVWADGKPVAFCYPVWQTETRWDVSIDTLREYRQRGLGARAARAMVRHMRQAGRSPVWGALDSNAPSRALAATLGFIETAGIAVFTKA